MKIGKEFQAEVSDTVSAIISGVRILYYICIIHAYVCICFIRGVGYASCMYIVMHMYIIMIDHEH